MASIIYVGMDVHSNTYSLCSYSIERQECFAQTRVEADHNRIVQYLKQVEAHNGGPCEFVCGYEAGCLGYTLYHELTAHRIHCVILASTTMMSERKRIKTDGRDAETISKCWPITPTALYIFRARLTMRSKSTSECVMMKRLCSRK